MNKKALKQWSFENEPVFRIRSFILSTFRASIDKTVKPSEC